jgi:ADP-heptose:LPS heptosyltransferase
MTRRLVVLRALGLGDLLVAVPALKALARAFPDHRRILLGPAALAPLAGLTGAVDDVIDVHGVDGLGALPPPAVRALGGADVAVNLHGSGPQSHRALLAAGPRRLIAFRHPEVWPEAASPPWDDGSGAIEAERRRWIRMLAAHGIAGDPDDLGLVPPGGPVPAPARGATVVHPGAASGARRWPLERWAAVVRHERSRGRPVVLTGGPGERSLTATLRDATDLPAACDLAGRTDITGLAAVVATSGRVVCGDTGVAHLATALGTPSVVLFGPVSPVAWGPPTRPWHRVLWAGRSGDPHADRVDPGLLAITVADVVAALDAVAAPDFRAAVAPAAMRRPA